MVDTISIYRTFDQIEVIQHWEKPPVMVDVHRRATVRELIDQRWDFEASEHQSSYYNGVSIWRGYVKRDTTNTELLGYGFQGGDGKIYRDIPLDAEIIISYKEPGTWRRLTDEARAALKSAALENGLTMRDHRSEATLHKIYVVLIEAGYLFRDGSSDAYLTYAGASIIPPDEVK